jgi:AraC family transcriptional regulator, carnitine catabolism transcriptional activator
MRVDRCMANARSIMEAHIEDPLSVEEIARQVGLSKRELQRRFQRLLRRNPIDFYREMRLKRALNLLQYSRLTIREIGIATGFSEPSTFYRAIRERFQKGPQELRASFHTGPSIPDGRRTGFND